MEVVHIGLAGLVLLIPRRFEDPRGWFSETWSRAKMEAAGLLPDFVQDNHSFSAEAGTLRGLHYQAPPYEQDKLVRCTRGAIFDVAVDARIGSPTFGESFGVEITAENGKQLFVPKGFLHGFVTLTSNTEVQYKVSSVYNPECDGAVHWDSVGIEWGLKMTPKLSAKDSAAPYFDKWHSPFRLEEK